jgi:regulator of sigma E protease
MMGLFKLLSFLIALTLLVFIHEWGHFLAARAVGIRVLRFSVGFGPVLFSRRLGADQTEWVFCALPLGGYVKMLGERTGEGLELTPSERTRSFEHASVKARALVAVAGPMANLILAVLLYTVLAWHGNPELPAVIEAPTPGTIAARAGLQANDRIVAVADHPVDSWNALRLQIFDAGLGGEPLFVEIERQGVQAAVVLDVAGMDAERFEKDPMGAIGLEPASLRILVQSVLEGSAAERAGLQAGDLVVAVDGDPVRKVSVLIDHIKTRAGFPTKLEVERNGTVLQVQLVPDSVAQESGAVVGRIGTTLAVQALTTLVSKGPLEGIHAGLRRTAEMTLFSFKMFGRMAMGQLSLKQLSGPVTIADLAGKSAQVGLSAYFGFLALISVSLGTLNLLPLPMLDGGHLVYCAMEAIRGRPLSQRTLEICQRLGLGLIVTMTLIALFNDFVRWSSP